jgi:hypothetical protein
LLGEWSTQGRRKASHGLDDELRSRMLDEPKDTLLCGRIRQMAAWTQRNDGSTRCHIELQKGHAWCSHAQLVAARPQIEYHCIGFLDEGARSVSPADARVVRERRSGTAKDVEARLLERFSEPISFR